MLYCGVASFSTLSENSSGSFSSSSSTISTPTFSGSDAYAFFLEKTPSAEVSESSLSPVPRSMDDSLTPSAYDCFASVSLTIYIGDVFVFLAI